MGELVPLQVTCLCTLVTALIAMKGLLSTVSEHLLVQASWPSTFIAAFIAAEGLLSTVKYRFQGTFYCPKSSKKCVCTLSTFYSQ